MKIFSLLRTFFSTRLSRGFSLLEQTLVLPILLGVIFGAIDVTNYFRAQNALKQGVHEGLRCLYPSDGGCVNAAAPASIPVSDLFIPPFFALQHNYDGLEKHLILPDYSFGSITAKVLDHGTYNPYARHYGTRRDLYSSKGFTEYFLIKRPTLSGSVQDASISGGTDLGPSGNPHGVVNSCRQNDSDAISIGAISFDTPIAPSFNDPYYELIRNCIESHPGDGTSQVCNRGLEGYKTSPNLFLNLKGDGFASAGNSIYSDGHIAGHVDINLYKLTNGEWRYERSLGGQDFTAQSGQNFIPRGFEYAHEGDRLNGSADYINHFAAHHNITVEFNSHYQIDFTLRGMRGAACNSNVKVGFRLSAKQVVLSEFNIDNEWLDCEGSHPFSELNNPSLCSINPAQSKYDSIFNTNIGPIFTLQHSSLPIGSDNFLFSQSCFDSNPGVSPLLHERGIYEGDVRWNDYSVWDNSIGGCGASSSSDTFSCPNNFGVSTKSQSDEHGNSYVVSSEALASCPPPSDAVLGSEKWYEGIITVYNQPSYKNGSDCSIRPRTAMPDALIPEFAKNYKKLLLPTAMLASTHSSYDYTGDPEEIRHTSQFNCPEISIGKIYYDEQHEEDFSEDIKPQFQQSLFVGNHEQLGCSKEEILKKEAIRFGMNPRAYFTISNDLAVPGSLTRIDLSHIDSCVAANADESLLSTNLRSKIPGGPFDEGIFPSQCVVRGQNACISIPAGVRQIEQNGKYIFDINNARTRAATAITAFMPNALTSDPICAQSGGANCVRLTLGGKTGASDFDPLKDDFELGATMELPLLILGNKPMNVSYSAKRAWEGKYAQ